VSRAFIVCAEKGLISIPAILFEGDQKCLTIVGTLQCRQILLCVLALVTCIASNTIVKPPPNIDVGVVLSRFTRELLSNENTHLIALTNQGAKYDLARSCAPRIHVVTPSWVEACYKLQRRVEEQPFDVLIDDEAPPQNNNKINLDLGRPRPSQPSEQTTEQRRKATKTTAPESISNRVDHLLRVGDNTVKHAPVFVSCRFLLLGFDADVEEQTVQTNSTQQLQQKLGKLIRRGKGTIYWDSHPSITHLVLHDACHDSLR
jgi:twin BRCT domain